MTADTVEIQGTLREDGTLVLDQKPNLPPGRVKVMVKSIVDYKQTDIWQFFQRMDAERKVKGVASRDPEETDAYLAGMRDDDERVQAIERIQAESQRHPEERPRGEE